MRTSGERLGNGRDAVARIWDLYLDVEDAAAVLHAAAVLERRDAIREPLPLDDAPRLLERLRTVARIAAEEATYWRYEAEDRQVEADGDGGRWGAASVARTMLEVARERAAGCREVADAARTAAEDLDTRLGDGPPPGGDEARRALREQAQRLLETGRLDER